MFKLSPRNRGLRTNKGFKVKHALQLILLLGIGIWLTYQIQRSYSKEKTYEDGNEILGKLQDEKVRFGRKDISEPKLESSNIDGEKKVEVEDVKSGEDEDERGKMEGKTGEKLVKEGNDESTEERHEEGKEEEVSREGEGWESEEKENEEVKEEEGRSEERGKEDDIDRNEEDVKNCGEEREEKGNEEKEDNNKVIKGNEENGDDETVKEESEENEKKEESEESGNEEGEGSSGSHVEEEKENEEVKEESKVNDVSQGGGQGKESSKDGSDKKSDENEAVTTKSKIESFGSSNKLVQDRNNESNRATIENQQMENSLSSSDNNEESLEIKTISLQEKPESYNSHSLRTGTTESIENKQANATTFSDETFASQNNTTNNITSTKEGDPNIQEITEKPGKRETGTNDNQLDENNEVSVKIEETNSGESGGSLIDGHTSYSDTSGHEGANGENPEKTLDSLSRTNSKENSNVDPHENPNVGPHVQGETSNESEVRKVDSGYLEHYHEAENVTQEVKDRTDLDTLPDRGNDGSNYRDVIAK